MYFATATPDHCNVLALEGREIELDQKRLRNRLAILQRRLKTHLTRSFNSRLIHRRIERPPNLYVLWIAFAIYDHREHD